MEKITDLAPLGCSIKYSRELKLLGLTQRSFLYHTAINGDGSTVLPVRNDADPLSAWTVTEMDIMFGNKYERPRLPDMSKLLRLADPLSYCVYLPASMLTFKKQADAYAEFLLQLIGEGLLPVAEINNRFLRFFPHL